MGKKKRKLKAAKITWAEVVMVLAAGEPGMEIALPLDELELPTDAGMTRSVGLPKGQLKDWRSETMPDGSGLHVLEFVDHYEVHIDRVDPHANLPGHVVQDVVPAMGRSVVPLFIAASTAVGVAGGAAVGKNFEQPVIGAGVGGAMGLITGVALGLALS